MRQALNNPLVRLVAGFTVWSVTFVLLYSLQALGCAYDWGAAHRPTMIAAFIACLVPLVILAFKRTPASQEAPQGLHNAAAWANRAALGAAILTYLPVLFATACQ